MTVEARAPGRVNLIGDHTDYTGGLVLPMAIDRWTVVRGERGGRRITLASDSEPEAAAVELPVDDARSQTPAWARYVAGVAAELGATVGLTGTVSSTLPKGGGLSSSAALEVAVALALGAPPDDPLALAALCQRAEHRAVGVPSGIMDQLTSAAGVEGHALLIDCRDLTVTPVGLPPATDAEVVVVPSGQERTLAGSAYAERVAQCRAAEQAMGVALRDADTGDVDRIADPLVRRRAAHVVSENARVRAFAASLAAGDLAEAGRLMDASHESLRTDYEVSTPELDALCARLRATDGVFGARLTGAGFGGCVVVLCRPGALGRVGWSVRAVGGASVVSW